jgi:peptidoglycan/LPS O-acetylase OafA/YrhL
VTRSSEAPATRPEIFLLRGIAVLAVLTYHLSPTRLPGGFAALDVFFVISGYLVTGILVGMRERHGYISFSSYLARRARRILPSAVVVLVACLVGMFALASIVDWGRIAGEILASSLFVENWTLILSNLAYAGADTASPVQHYWTLAVEAQFYLLWAVMLIVLLGRRGAPRRRAATVGIAVVFTASLITSAIWCTLDPAIGYLSTATRIWELAAGGLLAVLVHRIPPLRVGVPLAAVGWLMIAGAFVFLNSSLPWPGWLALIPVTGAILVIAAGIPVDAHRLRRLTDNRFTRTLADSSYAIYLWHWPLLVYAEGSLDRPLEQRDRIVIFVASLLLGWATTVLVERPIRFGVLARSRAMATLTVGALAIACVALPSAAVRVVMQRTGELYASVAVAPDPSLCRGAEALTPGADCVDGPYLGLSPDPLGDWEVISVLHGMGCATDNLLPTVKSCVFGDPDGTVNVALVGDSHAMKMWPALTLLADAEGWQLVTYLKAQCEYAAPSMEGTDNCKEWRADVAAQLDAAGPWDLVVTTGASHLTSPPGAADAFHAVWQPLIDDGAQLVDVRDVPYLATDIRSCVVDHLDNLSACDRPRVDAVLDDTMARTAGDLAGASVIDLTDFFCDATTCFAMIGGILTHRDGDHLTDAYSRSLAPAIGTQLRSIAPELFGVPSR